MVTASLETNDVPQSSSSRPALLVADDDEDIRTLVVAQLAREGWDVAAAGDIAGIRAALGNGVIDLIVLDLNLPDGDGLTLCRELRAEGHAGAIIMVTARDSAIDRVLGLELGADDYLTKPFEPRELLARVRNLLRRKREESPQRPHNARYANFGPWRLDLVKRRLITATDSLVMLSSTEYEILLRLVGSPHQALSREILLPERSATAAFDRSIDNQISRLRTKLAMPGGEELILTVRNQGYLLASDVRFE